MIITVDFDGTCVTNDFPYIGDDIGAVPVLKKLNRKGHKIILNTVRSKQYLMDAVNWFKSNGIELYGINSNPRQWQLSTSTKVMSDLYIDDLSLGVPRRYKYKGIFSDKPFVDWEAVELWLIGNDYL